jgi:hypothetical protein
VTSEKAQALCPECGASLETGFVGYFSGIMWHEEQLMALQRLFPFVLGAAQFIIGGLASTPWIRSRKALRCSVCGTLVVPASSMEPDRGRAPASFVTPAEKPAAMKMERSGNERLRFEGWEKTGSPPDWSVKA